MLDELYNSHKFNIDIFSYSSSINLGTGYEAFTQNVPLKEDTELMLSNQLYNSEVQFQWTNTDENIT